MTKTTRRQAVYIARSDEGPVKIGISHRPEKRLSGISSISGREFVQTYISPPLRSAGTIEKLLHAKFSEHRRHGEWFDIQFDDAVAALKDLGVSDEAEAWMSNEDYLVGKEILERSRDFLMKDKHSGKEAEALRRE